MSRRVGAFVEFDRVALQRLAQIPEEMINRVKDMSPVMEVIATEDLKPDMIRHLETQGEGSWPAKSRLTIERHGNTPLGVGEHGGFIPTIMRSWSRMNAVALTRAPHAHLFSGGTSSHFNSAGARVGVFSEGRRRVSRPESRSRLLTTFTDEHQPPRPFDYMDDETEERSTRRVAAFLVDEGFRGAI